MNSVVQNLDSGGTFHHFLPNDLIAVAHVATISGLLQYI